MKMNTKTFISIILILSCLLFLAGCGESAKSPDGGSGAPGGGQSESTGDGSPGAGPGSSGDGEVRMLMGEVVETIGNLVTLKLIDMPAMGGDTMVGRFGDMTEEEIAEMREQMQQAQPGDTMTSFRLPQGAEFSGGGPVMIGPGGEPPEGFQGEVRNSFRQDGEDSGDRSGPMRNYTGEELDIIIPVGAPVMELAISEEGLKESEIKLESLKSGDLLAVTYAADGKTVEKVVKQPSFNMGAGQTITSGSFAGGGPITQVMP